MFQLPYLVLFKSRLRRNDDVENKVQGADLTDVTHEFVSADYAGGLGRDFPTAPFALNREKVIEAMNISKKIKGSLYSKVITDKNEIKDLLLSHTNNRQGIVGIIPSDEDLKNAALILSYMHVEREEITGCLIKADEKIRKTENWQNDLCKTFSNISTIYMARWSAIRSAQHEDEANLSYLEIKHELGQAIAGIKSANRTIEVLHKDVTENIVPQDIINSCPNLPDTLAEFLNSSFNMYFKDVSRFTSVCSNFIENGSTLDGKININMQEMNPYNEVIYGLIKIYKEKSNYKQQMLIAQSPKKNVDVNSFIRFDAALLRRAVSNLIFNAIKYSHEFTNIYIDTEIGERYGQKTYELVFTNFGTPIPIEDNNNIFIRGFRASNATDESGLGIGLAIAQHLARLHGGDLEYVPHGIISEYNIPLLSDYIKRKSKRIDEDLKLKCSDEIKRLGEIHSYVVTKEKLKMDSSVFSSLSLNFSEQDSDVGDSPIMTDLTLQRAITNATARIEFRLWLPISRGDSNA